MALDANSKIFVVYVAIQEQEKMLVHSKHWTQIEIKAHISTQGQNRAKIWALLFDKAPTEVPAEYFDYSNVFSVGNIAELVNNTRMNKYAIKLEKNKQPFFGLFYSLKLETLKTYIKINLANGFIRSFKFPIGALILFDKKPDKSLCLCIDYWGLNNLTIKNQYPLLLINELLN